MKFDQIAGIIADMDGVLWRGPDGLPGLHELFALLDESELPFMLATNNSSKSPTDYVTKLNGLGVTTVREENIVSSGVATAVYLQQEYPIGADVHVLGGAGLFRLVEDAGFNIVDDRAEVVIVGLDFDLTYQKIKHAALLIRAGARFIATNPDRTFPSPEGLIPGAGSMIAMLEAATDVQAEYVGKPYLPMYTIALKRMGTDPAQTLMIGDRLDTDILGAQRVGMRTTLVMSGVTTPETLIDSDIQPDEAYDDLLAVVKSWQYAGGKRKR